MYYPDEIIEEVRARNDIVDVISSYVRLQKKGASYMGLCPFHNEKTPSFSVSPGKQMYYCFGCGAGGNVFTFLMEYENDTFVEAVKVLAERAGVALPDREDDDSRRQADLRTRLLAIHKEAARYYYYALRNEHGGKAMEYLKERQLTDGTIREFGLGFSGRGGGQLYHYLKSKGYEDAILQQSGLFTFDERRGAYDKFWNRVMFPIFDIRNRVIGFGGRVMGDGKPKYLNSPETRIFDKSRNLYGLNRARVSKEPYMLVCEGYMDVISMHQAGFTNAVASLGTALTAQQAVLLKRYTNEVILTYDSDGAGVRAALRAIPIMKEAGITTKVLNLKPYKDPDEFIKNEGEEALRGRIREAENSFYFEIGILEQDFELSDPDSKTKFFQEVAKRLLVFGDDLERNNYIEAVARKYFVSAEHLRKLVNRYGLVYGTPEAAARRVGSTAFSRHVAGPGEAFGPGHGLGAARRDAAGEDRNAKSDIGLGGGGVHAKNGVGSGGSGMGESSYGALDEAGYYGEDESYSAVSWHEAVGRGDTGSTAGGDGAAPRGGGSTAGGDGAAPRGGGSTAGGDGAAAGGGGMAGAGYAAEGAYRRTGGQRKRRTAEEGLRQSQRLFLTWLIEKPELFDKIQGILDENDFVEPLYHQAAKYLFEGWRRDRAVNPAGVIGHFESKEEQSEVASLFHATLPDQGLLPGQGAALGEDTLPGHTPMTEYDKRSWEKAVNETVKRIKKQSLDEQGRRAAETGDREAFARIIQEQAKLQNFSISI